MKQYYHYTPEDTLEEIIKSEQINLAETSVSHKKEHPVAWVSTNEHWEHTATKLIIDVHGKLRQLTFEEQEKHFGCARIVVEGEFMTWAKLKYVARMDAMIALAMEQAGREMGGDPKEWFGSLQPIGIDQWIRAEVLRDGVWVEYDVFK